MKRVITALFVLASAGALLSVFSQVKIAFVDSEIIIAQLPEAKEVQGNLEGLGKLYMDTIGTKETEIKTKADAFTAKYEDAQKQMEAGLLTAEQVKALEAELGEMQRELQALDQNLQTYKQTAQNELLEQKEILFKPVREKITKAIEQLAKELKYNMVLDKASSAVIYGDKDIDITFKVLDKLK